MKATLAAIADAASLGAGDKLTVQGVFDTIFVSGFPATHPRMVLVLRLQLDHRDSTREHRVSIRLEDEHGSGLFEQTARTSVGIVPPGECPSANLICELTNISFAGPGRYRFLVRAGGGQVALPLRIVRRER